MKKALTALAVIGGMSIFGFAIYKYFEKQIALLKQFTWKMIDFSVDTLDLQLIKGNIKFRFASTSDLEIVVSKFYLDLYVNDERVGYIEDTNTFIIPARGYTDIPFAYTLNPQLIIKNSVDIILLSTKLRDAVIKFNGYANIKSGFISTVVPVKTTCSVKNLDCTMV